MARSYRPHRNDLDEVKFTLKKKRKHAKQTDCDHRPLEHTISSTASGKRYAKCDRCGTGLDYDEWLEAHKKEKGSDPDDVFRDVQAETKRRNSFRKRKYGNRSN